MPNWVYNSMSVSGSKEDIAKFKEFAGRPKPEGFDNETGKFTYEEGETEVFSFWNFIAPPQDAIESGEYFGTHGFVEGKQVGDTPNNWYEFNTREWGTKWDACRPELESENETSLLYRFETAWSIPEPVFSAVIEKFPTLDFDFESEEEQGWGAKYTSSAVAENGERSLILEEEWDIPDSHADYVARGNEEGCNCQSDPDDEEYWYDDCPRPSKEFEIVVKQVVKITAKDAESAWEIANGVLETFAKTEQPDGVVISEDSVAWVEENGVRVYPTLTEVA